MGAKVGGDGRIIILGLEVTQKIGLRFKDYCKEI
jgi:hypothetical protein